jgi:hypothetical protein
MKNGRIQLLLAALLAMACTPVVLRPEVGAALRAGQVGVMVYMDQKTIEYNEKVYKVLWNEDRRQEAVFSGFWDIDRDMTEELARDLQGIGVRAVAVNKALPESDFTALSTAMASAPPLGDLRPLTLPSPVQEALATAKLDYLIVLRSTHFLVLTGFITKIDSVVMPSTLFVYDARKAKTEYQEPFPIAGILGFEESPRDIEKNGLARLKQGAHGWLEKAAQHTMREALSFDP